MFIIKNIEIDHSISNLIITSIPNIILNKYDQPMIINLVQFNIFSYEPFFLELN